MVAGVSTVLWDLDGGVDRRERPDGQADGVWDSIEVISHSTVKVTLRTR
jgi:hypothetical protein